MTCSRLAWSLLGKLGVLGGVVRGRGTVPLQLTTCPDTVCMTDNMPTNILQLSQDAGAIVYVWTSRS